MLFKDWLFFFFFPNVLWRYRVVCNGYRVSLIVPAQFSETRMCRCFRDLESIYYTRHLGLEDMIYYLATCNMLVLPGKSL